MAYATAGTDHVTEPAVGVTGPLTANLRRVSWGAIFAGVVVALAVQVLLSMLGAGVGLASIEPAQVGDNPSATSMGIGAAAWWAISGIIAAFLGGWVAARLAGQPSRESGMLHGLAAWAVATLMVLYMLSSTATSIIGGAFNVAGQAASGLGSAAGGAVSAVAEQANPLDQMMDEVQAAANPNDPEAAGQRLSSAVRRMLTGDGDAVAEARQAAVDVMVQQGVPQEEAQQRVQGWEQQYQQARDQAAQQARAAADAAADGASTAAFYAFIALLLGAIAGAFGGRAGTPALASMVATRTTRID